MAEDPLCPMNMTKKVFAFSPVRAHGGTRFVRAVVVVKMVSEFKLRASTGVASPTAPSELTVDSTLGLAFENADPEVADKTFVLGIVELCGMLPVSKLNKR